MAHMLNAIATPNQLQARLSRQLPPDLLDAVFVATQCLTQAAGLLLGLSQGTTSRANVLLTRYWVVENPMEYEFYVVSATAIFIATKMSPNCRTSTRDIAVVYSYLLSSSSPFMRSAAPSSPGDPPPPDPDPHTYYISEHAYHAFNKRLLLVEAVFLAALSFDTHVSLPHGLAVTYLQTLSFIEPRSKSQSRQQQEASTSVARRTIQLLNVALLSPQQLYVTHQPHALATAAIYAAARECGIKMPACEWWEVFDVDREELGFLVVAMRSLEGHVEKLRADVEAFGSGVGMLTRDMVLRELEGRMRAQEPNGNGPGGQGMGLSGEEETLRLMDETSAAAASRAEAER